MSKTAGSIVEAALKRDPHEPEFIQSVQEVVHALERVIAKNSQLSSLYHYEKTVVSLSLFFPPLFFIFLFCFLFDAAGV